MKTRFEFVEDTSDFSKIYFYYIFENYNLNRNKFTL